MVTRDVLKVLKLHSPTAHAILRTFKTSLVPINHEMHSRSYDLLYLFSWYKWIIQRYYSREKFKDGHSYKLEGQCFMHQLCLHQDMKYSGSLMHADAWINCVVKCTFHCSVIFSRNKIAIVCLCFFSAIVESYDTSPTLQADCFSIECNSNCKMHLLLFHILHLSPPTCLPTSFAWPIFTKN